MSFILIIFANRQRTAVARIMKFRKMKDIISLTNGRVNYYDVRRNHGVMKYDTIKSLFQVIKV